MRRQKNKYNYLKTLALSPLLVAMFPSYGQEAPVANLADEVEVIEVKGFRGSLEKAMNLKRTAKNISDAISSEDIGKSADQNIAEALQRVTGIAINRADGEGTTVTVRGVASSLNVVTLNGVPLTGSGDSQGVNFSEFSSDILDNIEVQKTPSASSEEGSLGATIKLTGFKPLNVKKNRRNIDIQGRKNNFAETEDFKAQFSFSEKLFDDTLGLSIIATKEESGTRVDSLSYGNWRTVSPPLGATNVETGEVVTSWDYDGDGVLEPLEVRQAGEVNLQNQSVQRDRDTIAATLQLLPWDGGEFQLDLTYATQDIRRDNRFISTSPKRNGYEVDNIIFDPNTFDVISHVDTAITNAEKAQIEADTGAKLPGNVRNVGVIRNQRQINHDSTENKVISLAFNQSFENVELSMRAGHSETTSTPEFNLRGFFRGKTVGQAETGVQSGYNCLNSDGSYSGGDLLCNFSINPGYVDDPANFEFQAFSNPGRISRDESDSFYADLEWEKEWSIFTSFETGVKWTSREKFVNASNSGNCNRGCVGGELNTDTLADYSDGSTSGDLGLELGLTPSEYTDGFPIFDINSALTQLEALGVADKINVSFLDTKAKIVEEDVKAAYVQGNFEFLDGKITGDIGLRVAQTKVKATGDVSFRYDFQQDTFANEANVEALGSAEAVIAALGPIVARDTAIVANTETHDYTNLLPSLNLNWAVQDDLIVRFGTSQTIARPRLNGLAPNFTINEQIHNEFTTANAGTVDLKPFKSTNLDLSVEWYFDKTSVLSVAIFNKDFSDFEEKSQKTYYWRDVRGDYFDLSDPSVVRAPALLADQVAFQPSIESVLLDVSDGDNQLGCMPNRELDLLSPNAEDSCDTLLLTQTRNGQGGYVRGLEFALQHTFDYLPGFWSGFGGVINYTYADSALDAETLLKPDGSVDDFIPEFPLHDTSEHTLNLTAFWEMDGKLIRLAYNTRSDYLTNRSANEYGSVWVEGFDTLDLSASWDITDWASVNFQAVNLLDTVTRQYSTIRPNVNGSNLPAEASDLGSQPTHRTARLSNTGTMYRLGLRLTF